MSMPYDQLMGDLRRNAQGMCPLATQDLQVNTQNRDASIQADHIQYGPMNLTDEAYWVGIAEFWNTTPDVAQQSLCGNCAAFDVAPRMKACMPGEDFRRRWRAWVLLDA